MKKTAVLLLAYGGPNSLDDIPAFLREVRGGPPVPQPLIDETTRRYRLIGGRSPLLGITRRLASKLQSAIDLPVYVGMRHWHPFIADTVHEMMRDEIEHIVAICLAPHYSPMSIGAYRARLEEAVTQCHCEEAVFADEAISKQVGDCFAVPSLRSGRLATLAPHASAGVTVPTVDFIESWHTQPQYIAGIAQNVHATLAQFPSDAKIIFTAHSLPVSTREPYESQLRETAQLVAQNLGLRDDRWMLCYQSKPRAGGEWLDPQIENLVPQLARDGEKNLAIAPIGFLADHLEVLYDLDIAMQEISCANEMRLARTPMLNDSDALVNALTELVKQRNTEHAIRVACSVLRKI